VVTNCDLLEPTLGDLCKGPYSRVLNNLKATYWCPSSNPGRGYCNFPGYFYCAYWRCETIATSWEVPIEDKNLAVEWNPRNCLQQRYDVAQDAPCTALNITIKIRNPSDPGWTVGRTWGVRLYESGTDSGGLIFTKKEEVRGPPQGITPNPIIGGPATATSLAETTEDRTGEPPLWKAMQATCNSLNQTNPNLTTHCWLCYDVKPPFYKAIGVNTTHRLDDRTAPPQCSWEDKKRGITMQHVSGSGVCIGKVRGQKWKLCSFISPTLRKTKPGPSDQRRARMLAGTSTASPQRPGQGCPRVGNAPTGTSSSPARGPPATHPPPAERAPRFSVEELGLTHGKRGKFSLPTPARGPKKHRKDFPLPSPSRDFFLF